MAEKARLAQAAFDRHVRPRLTPADDGKYVAVDIDTGEYEIDADDYAASERLIVRRPGGRAWHVPGRTCDDLPPRLGRAMIRGAVSVRYEAVVRVRLHGPTGPVVEVDAVIDIGYTGALTLPADVVSRLGLSPRTGGTAKLADGTEVSFDTVGVELEWDGTFRAVVASGLGPQPLVGMTQLAGHELRGEVAPYGVVEVRPLGPPVF